MDINAKDVMKLKDITNAGVMDCKKALIEANGNFDEALKVLKEKGLADTKKRSDKETKEGGVFVATKENKTVIILLGCETDFVSGNDIFKSGKDKILNKALETLSESNDTYLDLIQDIGIQTKEKIELKAIKCITLKANQMIKTYIHGNNKIGVAVIFDVGSDLKDSQDFVEMSNNVAMHIAASNPLYLESSQIPEKDINEQKEIFIKQLEGSKKPQNVIDNIVKGKLEKYYGETCLVNQPYVKDDKISISQYIESVSKKIGADIKINSFIRYMIG